MHDKLNTDNMEKHMWLVKVPAYLYECLQKLDEDDMEIGTVHVPKNEGGKMLVTFNNQTAERLPKEYNLQIMKQPQRLYPFCEDDGELSIRGVVEDECLLQPVYNEEYRRTVRERELASMSGKRQTQRMFGDGLGQNIRPSGVTHLIVSENSKLRKRSVLDGTRRARLPRENVQDMLFKAFEEKAYWTLQSLSEYTSQPGSYLREVLDEIGIFYTRGEYKNMFVLKPEFKEN
eukprot:GHVN01098174.1.p2 GENE.GHVN01098174.1~~GHVN01098174.1.p2  ORF type:complete len:232 (-),score=27.51 GHVN01098174.1:3025-3720(-)